MLASPRHCDCIAIGVLYISHGTGAGCPNSCTVGSLIAMSLLEASVVELMRLSRMLTYHYLAAVAILLYDLVASLEDEIRFVWRAADTFPKFLYFISRYFGLLVNLILAFQILPPYCQPTMIFEIIAFDILSLSIEINLMLRLYALYRQSRRAAVVLRIVFCGQIMTVITFNVLSYRDFDTNFRPYPPDWPIGGCYPLHIPPFYHSNWVPLLTFETFLFVMMAVKCHSYRPMSAIPILQRIWRDGTSYYLIVMVTIALRIVAPLVSATTISNVAIVWNWAIFSFTGAHLTLDVRVLAAARCGVEVDTPMISDGIHDVIFDNQPSSPPMETHELLTYDT